MDISLILNHPVIYYPPNPSIPAPGKPRLALPLPSETILDILESLPRRECWALARACKTHYLIALEHILFRTLHLGFRKEVLNPDGTEFTIEQFPKVLCEESICIPRYRIGGRVRHLKVILEETANPHDDEIICDAMQRIFCHCPKLVAVDLYGRRSPRLFSFLVSKMAQLCKNVTTLLIQWVFLDIKTPAEEVFQYDFLPRNLTWLYFEIKICKRGPQGATVEAVETILMASIGTLRYAKLMIGTRAPVDNSINWKKFIPPMAGSQRSWYPMRKLHYEIESNNGEGDRYDYIMNDICDVFPSIVNLTLRFCRARDRTHHWLWDDKTYRQFTQKPKVGRLISPELIKIGDRFVHILSKLRNCQTFDILGGLPIDIPELLILDAAADNNHNQQQQQQRLEQLKRWTGDCIRRRYYVLDRCIAHMPSLRKALFWYLEGDVQGVTSRAMCTLRPIRLEEHGRIEGSSCTIERVFKLRNGKEKKDECQYLVWAE